MQTQFGNLRRLLTRLEQNESSTTELFAFLEKIQHQDEVRFNEQWIPYLSSQEAFRRVSLTTVDCIGQLEELVDRFPFAFFSMDVSYYWHRHDWFVDLARCREMTQVLSCTMCGNELRDEDAQRLASCSRLKNLKVLDVRSTFLSSHGLDSLRNSPHLKPSCRIIASSEDAWWPSEIVPTGAPSDSDYARHGIQNFGASREFLEAIESRLYELHGEIHKDVNGYVFDMANHSLDKFPSVFRLSGEYHIESIQLIENNEVWISCHITERWREVKQGYLGLEFCWVVDPWGDELITKLSVNSSAI